MKLAALSSILHDGQLYLRRELLDVLEEQAQSLLELGAAELRGESGKGVEPRKAESGKGS